MPALTKGGKPKRRYKANGYAASPGTGPYDETCRTCFHRTRHHYHGKVYNKCGLVKPTHGPGTDILCKSPACYCWKKIES